MKLSYNIYEQACENIATLVLTLATLKNLPMLDGDARIVAEAVADRLDLTDIHALVEKQARTAFDPRRTLYSSAMPELGLARSSSDSDRTDHQYAVGRDALM